MRRRAEENPVLHAIINRMSKNVNAFIRKLAATQRREMEARAAELITEEMKMVKKTTDGKSAGPRLRAPL